MRKLIWRSVSTRVGSRRKDHSCLAWKRSLPARVGRAYAVAVCNGSAALDLAVAALGIGPGDEVILPAFTIISCAAAVVRAGAKPVIVDCEPDTWNVSAAKVAERITARTRAIMVVHIYGLPVDMDPVLALAAKHGLSVIEDAAEMHGQTYKGQPCGSFGDISTFSFYPNKLVTTGEGGMVLTDDEATGGTVPLVPKSLLQTRTAVCARRAGLEFPDEQSAGGGWRGATGAAGRVCCAKTKDGSVLHASSQGNRKVCSSRWPPPITRRTFIGFTASFSMMRRLLMQRRRCGDWPKRALEPVRFSGRCTSNQSSRRWACLPVTHIPLRNGSPVAAFTFRVAWL